MICSHEGAIPIWLQALSGNRVDSASFPQTVRAYLKALKEQPAEPVPYLVADTALFTQGTLAELGTDVRWITRVPASLKLVKMLYQTCTPAEMIPVLDDTYRVCPLCTTYGDVRQRWVVVYSEAIQRRQTKTVRQHIEREYDEATKRLRQLARRDYPTPDAARAAAQTVAETWRFHTVEVTCEAVPHYHQRGRPTADQAPDYFTWRPLGEPREDAQAVATRLAQTGKFVLATNDLDDQRLPMAEIIALYKAQNTTVERGFRFLKDPLFFAHSLFLKKPARIMAVLMVMGLCLLIYALAEHRLRQALRDTQTTLPNQLGQPTQSITLRRVFQIFEGIHLVTLQLPAGQQQFVTNLLTLHHLILHLLGSPFEKIYSASP